MKYAKPATAIAAGLTLAATQASAGGLAEPMMEPELIEESSATTGGFIVPLVLLAIILALASGSNGGSTPVESPG